jgi:HEPN domain-containing protein
MNKQEKFDCWLKGSRYDIETANILFKNGYWRQIVPEWFFAIEKLAIGIYIFNKDDNFPRSDNIWKIINSIKLYINTGILDEICSFLNELSSYYLNSIYPDYENLSSYSLNKDKA